MRVFRTIIFSLCLSLALVSCDSVNSQQTNLDAQDSSKDTVISEKKTSIDIDELAKAGAEELNKEQIPVLNPAVNNNGLSRKQIRKALIANELVGDSSNGEIGGFKIVHYSHVCNLIVEKNAFYVVKMDSILQQASSGRADSRTLIFDESMKLIHNLSSPNPLFCDGNRLLYNDYELATFYDKPEKLVKGNVLIFTDGAKNIEGKLANLNFYKFRDLIH